MVSCRGLEAKAIFDPILPSPMCSRTRGGVLLSCSVAIARGQGNLRSDLAIVDVLWDQGQGLAELLCCCC